MLNLLSRATPRRGESFRVEIPMKRCCRNLGGNKNGRRKRIQPALISLVELMGIEPTTS